jgi:hypothetical protein
MSKTYETRIQPNGQPRTKGMRNPIQEYATQGTHGGPMRDRRERRPKDARRSWKGEEWGYTLMELVAAIGWVSFIAVMVSIVAVALYRSGK